MDSIIEAIEEWLRGLLVSGIMNNLNNTFNSVNTQVGEIATEVGTTPASFSPAVFNMIKNRSENVIMPIAGILLTFIRGLYGRGSPRDSGNNLRSSI